jgi:hypothetical protein
MDRAECIVALAADQQDAVRQLSRSDTECGQEPAALD